VPLVRLRLVQRIYILGVLQFLIVAVGIIVLLGQSRPPTFFAELSRYVVDGVSAQSDRPESLQSSLDRVHTDLHWTLAVYDDQDALVAAAGSPIPAPPSASEKHDMPSHPGPSHEVRGSLPIDLRGRKGGHFVYQIPSGPGPPGLGATAILALVVVGISSWLTARALAAPLARLVAATNAFGAGNLAARVRMRRSDELGDVANAFDDMAERVMKSFRSERELFANISHELRTPLQRIHIAVDLAAEGDATIARESLVDIAEDLAELERIVDDVLTATRLSLQDGGSSPSAVPPVRAESVKLHGLLDKAITRFRGSHPERVLEALLVEDSTVTVDPVLFRRVIDNLLENAEKYTDDASKPIALTSRRDQDSAVIEVSDLGIGIGAEDLDRVFEPFFRVDRSRTRSTGGLGLGLSLARRIVEAHGGTLSLKSQPGQGTTVRIELPTSGP
jgi:two-component system OmpR family sensor kinase